MGKNLYDLSVIRRELQYYKKMRIPEGVDEKKYRYEEVIKRPISLVEVSEDDFEDRLFFIEIENNYKLVGYKILVDYFINKGNGIADIDSRIKADMLLGIYKHMQIENGVISIMFYCLEPSEKKYAFNKIRKDIDLEITYPIVINADPLKMPKWEDVWLEITETKTEEEMIEFLSNTEPHFRKYTEEVLKKRGENKFVIFDPACSTGEFLEYVKIKFPDAYTIGHDMDEKMIKIAKNRVDEFACCNAFDSPILPKSIDILVLRFLNYAVVSREEAENLFEKLIKTVKEDGLIICFGHTPVLLDGRFFMKQGLNMVGKIGYEESTDSIFQYYVLKR